jgi:Na+-transporting methylmalonyl-CoA/oxaloacetate decarboxylase gamma subunit
VNGFFYFEAKVPAALLDGAVRQVDISDETYNMSIDVKIPVFSVLNPATPPEAGDERAGTQEPSRRRSSDESGSSSSQLEILEIFGEYTVVIFIGAGAALVVIILLIILIAGIGRSKKKKKNANRNQVMPPANNIVQAYNPNSSNDKGKTEFFGDINSEGIQHTIKLSVPGSPNKTWTLTVAGELLIGRADNCSVILDDKSISREQCKITAHGGGLAVVHLSSTNKTILNGTGVSGSSPLKSGDTLKFGRETLHVDYIQTLGSPVSNSALPHNHDKGNTESIF